MVHGLLLVTVACRWFGKTPFVQVCTTHTLTCPWHAGAISRASDLRITGRGFETSLGTIAQWPWASYLHLCAFVTKQYNLVPVKGRLPCNRQAMVRVWVAGKTVWSRCYTQAVSFQSGMTACWLCWLTFVMHHRSDCRKCNRKNCCISICIWAVWITCNKGSLLLLLLLLETVKQRPHLIREIKTRLLDSRVSYNGYNCMYHLRRCTHDRQLPTQISHLCTKNFVTRALYKDCYWIHSYS